MELIIRVAAVAVLGCAAALLLKRGSAELTVPLAAAVCAFALTAAAGALEPAVAFLNRAKILSGLGEAYFLPVMKCVAIGIVTKAAADLCRDGGQGAMAGAVELGGTAAALYVALPLLETLLEMLETML